MNDNAECYTTYTVEITFRHHGSGEMSDEDMADLIRYQLDGALDDDGLGVYRVVVL